MSSVNQNVYCFSFETIVPECVKNLYIKTEEYQTDLVVEFIDKFMHVYQQEITTDINGFLKINMDLFPSFMYNRHSGQYLITIYPKGSTNKNPINIPVSIGYVKTISIRFIKYYTTNNVYPYDYLLDETYYKCCCDNLPVNCN